MVDLPCRTNGTLNRFISSQRVNMMKRWQLSAFEFDRQIADAVARNSTPFIERPLNLLTRAADEHVLVPAVLLYWLVSGAGSRARKNDANHLLLTVVTATLLPHLLKQIFAQERPDRIEIHGNRHGVPCSGKPQNAFPSGHAVHMGALAAALSRMFPGHRVLIWSLASSLALTRVALLAHWFSDVVAGGALGVLLESLLHAFDRKPEV